MNKNDWYNGLNLADDKYIDEANPNKIVKIKSRRSRAIKSILAACACLALVFCSLWLFIPFNTNPPDVSQHSGSEYYSLIEKLNIATYRKPRYKNNAEKLWANIKDISAEIIYGEKLFPPQDSTTAPTYGAAENYQEITDNQVDGIIEADRIKRSNTHIYYLDENVLRIYSIDKESSRLVSSYAITNDDRYNLTKWEFYLSDDCKTVTIITQNYKKSELEMYVSIISLDVSNPSFIKKTGELNVTGNYMTSRKADGNILILTQLYLKNVDFNDESTFVPQIDDGDGYHSIPAKCIITPDNLNNPRYTVVMKLDENTLELKGTAAYLSYSDDVYISENHVFLTRVFSDSKENDDGTTTRNSMTEISCLTYGGDSFEIKGSATVRGYVKDQWSMDEYNGILRVFTTTDATIIREKVTDNTYTGMILIGTGPSLNASLYCVDLSTFEIVASVIDFAPPRENIQSVRFDKENAYVCTSIELSDPVFFFDLSDLNNITHKDTGTIEGFSTSLINLGNGYLLGIGRGDRWNSFKAEVYEETADGVRSVSAYKLNNAEYSTEYKSYYIDRANQIIGIGIQNHADYQYNGDTRYLVLHFNGYELTELVNIHLDGETKNMRGVYIDGYMYMFGSNDFKTYQIF